MNVIYLHTHDLGRYIEPYGFAPRTPNLQRLAQRGVLFRNAFSAAPTCSPSRAALLTGCYPHQAGMFGLTGQGWTLQQPDRHIGTQLQAAGMETVLIGAQHVTEHTPEAMAKLPYDRILHAEAGPSADESEIITPAAIAYLREAHERPFFLNVGYELAHHSSWDRCGVLSRETMGPIDPRYVRPLAHLPDTPDTRWDAALRIRATEYLDARIGLLLDALDETGLADNTLVIFTTDHGPGLPGVKVNLNDRGTGVALILAGPAHKGAARTPSCTGGRVIDPPVSQLDLYPTLCELLGLKKPDWLEGQSWLPLLDAPDQPLHDALFFEQSYHGKYVPLRSVRTGRYRYVRRLGPDRSVLHFSADGGAAYDALEEAGLSNVVMPREQLYDLVRDPQESLNLIDDPSCATVADDLRRRLERWMARTQDPALNDAIPSPPPRPASDPARARRKERVVAEWHRRMQALRHHDAEAS